jgi:2'-5' RNA ligase
MRSIDRGFVAVVPPESVLDAIDARVAPVRAAHSALRWSGRQQWHVTLRFLGRVPDVDRLLAAMHDALASVPRVGALRLGGADAFPSAQRASVVWVGVRDGADDLTRIAAAVESVAVAVGFAPETRPFSPHLTVARVARASNVERVLDELGHDPVGGAWPVDDVVLVSSDTRSTGSVYHEVARVQVASGARA